MNSRKEILASFNELLDIMDRLRDECPWDKKQTIESLRYLTIEEMYELSDAILDNDLTEIKNELGDVLLHLVFYSKIGSEKKAFDFGDVSKAINEKLIRRHPHIFSDTKVETEDEVKANWEKIKLKEGNGNRSVLEGVPTSLPALVKSYRMQEKARGVGFDWDNISQVWDKVKEEEAELFEAIESGKKEDIEEEFGDLLFSLINYSRFIDVNPEDALDKTNRKFRSRFMIMEKYIKQDNKDMCDMNLSQLDHYWELAKKELKR